LIEAAASNDLLLGTKYEFSYLLAYLQVFFVFAFMHVASEWWCFVRSSWKTKKLSAF